jgi:pyruvate-formate lyase
MNKLAALIKTSFEHGGKHIQFNVVNRETLVEAQEHPEKHHDLIRARGGLQRLLYGPRQARAG